MAGSNMIIVDESFLEMAAHCVDTGEEFDALVERYINCLNSAKSNGLIGGRIAAAFQTYITYASRLRERMGEISNTVSQQIESFIAEVDAADEGLF